MIINEADKVLYNTLDEQLSLEEMKDIKYKLFEIEKARAIKKAAEEVEKKFLGKTTHGI